MAANNKSTEEDYLDNLLKSVIGGSNSDSNMSDDDIMDNIEKEVFEEGDEDIDELVENENIDELNLDDELAESGIKKKKERKHLFGRRKNKKNIEGIPEVSAEEENVEEIPEVSNVEENVEEIPEVSAAEENEEEIPEVSAVEENVEEIPEVSAEEKNEEEIPEVSNVEEIPEILDGMGDLFSGVESLEDDMPKAPEGFEDIFEDNPDNSDLLDLANAIGSSQSVESLDNDIAELEDDSGKGRKRRRKKKAVKEKKGFFKRKKKKSGSQEEETENYENEIEEIEEIEEIGDNNLGIEGFGELGDFFADDSGEDSVDTQMDIADLEALDEEPEEEETQKKKKEKKKKVKKKKEKKKKVKKPKEKKVREKKPKKPKEPDVVIPLPVPFIIFSASLIVLLIVFLKLSGSATYYTEKTGNAASYYLNEKYEEAYNEIAGMEMKSKDDKYFFNKLSTIMYVDRHLSSYENLYKLEKYDDALFALLRGVKMYDKHIDDAKEYGCEKEFKTVYGGIKDALKNKYGLSEEQAREVNNIVSINEFSQKVYELSDNVIVTDEEETSDAEKTETKE